MKAKQYVQTGMILIGMVVIILGFSHWSTQHHGNRSIVDSILAGLKESRWEKRDEVLQVVRRSNELIQDENVREALLDLLADENERGKRIMEKYRKTGVLDIQGEAYGEYNIDLVDMVIRLKKEKAIPLLVDAIAYGPMVAEALAEFGDGAIPPLIEKCKGGDEEERWPCLGALALCYQRTSSSQFKTKIRDVVSEATKDPNERISSKARIVLNSLQ